MINRGIVNLNDLFQNEYHYTDQGELNEQPFIELELNGKREKFWFYYHNQKYLFKKQEKYSDDIYAEVIAEEIAETLGINSAKYTLATFDNDFGVISENFIKKDERLVLGLEIISTVMNRYGVEDADFRNLYDIDNLDVKDVHNKLNNLEDIWSILDLYFKDNPNKNKIVQDIITDLVKVFIFDLITMQGDRHINNWGIIINEKQNYFKISPLFDNSNICGLNRSNVKKAFEGNLKSIKKNYHNQDKVVKSEKQLNQLLYHSKLLFSVSEDDTLDVHLKKKKENLDILDYFMEVSSFEFIDLINKYLDKLDEVGIEQIIVNKENKMGVKIPEDVKQHMINTITLNCIYIRIRIENYYNKKGWDQNGKSKI